MQEARKLNPDHPIASEPNGSASLTKLLEAFESDRIKRNADEAIVYFTAAPGIEPDRDSSSSRPSPELTVDPKPNTSSDFLAPTQAAPSSAITAGAGPKWGLLDIYTPPIDRDRAIGLRWMLRDAIG